MNKIIKNIFGIFLVFVLLINFFLVNISAANNSNVLAAVVNELKAVDYEGEIIANKLAPLFFSSIDKVAKQKELAAIKNIPFLSVSEQEVLDALKKENIYKLSYKDSFKKVQDNIENIISKMLDYENSNQTYNSRNDDYYINLILANKENFLLGLTFIDRFYNFNVEDGKKLSDILMYEPNRFGYNPSPFNYIINLGAMEGTNYIHINNVKVYDRYIKNVVTDKNLVDFIKTNLSDGIDFNQWFKEASKAIIFEKESNEKPEVSVKLFDKLIKENNSTRFLLPLLTIPENNLFVITNTATITIGNIDTYIDKDLKNNQELYSREIEKLKIKINDVAEKQRNFIDFWYRIVPEQAKNLNTNRIIIDSFSLENGGNNPNWSTQFGNGAASGVENFFTPFRMYASYIFVDAVADGAGVRNYLAKALTDKGLMAYTHELTHLLEQSVWFNDMGERTGYKAEFYARGLFESYKDNTPIFNFNLIYENQDLNYLFNHSPERFQKETDLKEYFKVMFDVLYTLDFAEAESILNKNSDDKVKWLKSLKQELNLKPNVSNGILNDSVQNSLDNFLPINKEKANLLTDVYSLIDNDIVVSRYEYKGRERFGKSTANDYLVVSMFSPIFATSTNEFGVSGDVISRRQAFEFLEAYGYFNGMVPYISNQYKIDATNQNEIFSDKFIISKIFNGEHNNDLKQFKKDRFKLRIDNISKLKEIDIQYEGKNIHIENFETIKELMDQAIIEDLANQNNFVNEYHRTFPHDTKVEKLKKSIYLAYKNLTNDFRDSIYKEELMKDVYQPITSKKVFDRNEEIVIDRFIDNKEKLPLNTRFESINPISSDVGGEFVNEILIIYSDNSSEKINIDYKIKTDTEKHEVVFGDINVKYNSSVDFNLSILNISDLPDNIVIETQGVVDTTKQGAHSIKMKVIYEDGTFDESNISVFVGNSMADEHQPETSKKMYFKNADILAGDLISNKEQLPYTSIEFITAVENVTHGDKQVRIKVIYQDKSFDLVDAQYYIKNDSETFNIEFIDISTGFNLIPDASIAINNIDSLPKDIVVSWVVLPDVSSSGDVLGKIKVLYQDGSYHEQEVTVSVGDSMADLHNPQTVVKTINKNDSIIIEDLIKNKDQLPINTKYTLNNQPDLSNYGEKEIEIKVSYPDASFEIVKAKLNVLSDAETTKVEVKNIKVLLGEAIDPLLAIVNFNQLPTNTKAVWLNNIDSSIPGVVVGMLELTFADGSKLVKDINISINKNQAMLNSIKTKKLTLLKDELIEATDFILNLNDLPKDIKVAWEKEVDTKNIGENQAQLKVLYSDNSFTLLDVYYKVVAKQEAINVNDTKKIEQNIKVLPNTGYVNYDLFAVFLIVISNVLVFKNKDN